MIFIALTVCLGVVQFWCYKQLLDSWLCVIVFIISQHKKGCFWTFWQLAWICFACYSHELTDFCLGFSIHYSNITSVVQSESIYACNTQTKSIGVKIQFQCLYLESGWEMCRQKECQRSFKFPTALCMYNNYLYTVHTRHEKLSFFCTDQEHSEYIVIYQV